MRDLLDDIETWLAAGLPVSVATVTRTWGSAPRGEGAKLAIAPGDRLSGSVSGGCVENAVYEAGLETLRTGDPQALRFGVADETAWEIGLACGGTIEVFVERLSATTLEAWREAVGGERTLASAIVIGGEGRLGERFFLSADDTDPLPGLNEALSTAASAGRSRRETLGASEVFIDVIAPPYQVICIGAAHISIPLSRIAATMGYRVTVIDPRAAFASPTRFPGVDALIVDWPLRALAGIPITQTTAIVALTHDPKIADPALEAALASPAFYIGALGSARTHAARLERLAARGLAPEVLARIHGPIGLDLGAHDPAEIAVAIMAQIVAVRNDPGPSSKHR